MSKCQIDHNITYMFLNINSQINFVNPKYIIIKFNK